MNKKVLFIYYSQSGQLGDIIDNFSKAFESPDIQTEIIRVHPETEYEFPWKLDNFFETMPESVHGIPIKLKPLVFKENQYDLIVFGYQPWFLSPSLPATSLLLHPTFQNILKDTPVVTIIGCRNMWISSQERIKVLLKNVHAKLVGNIVLSDRHGNLTSLVTILYWMRTAKRDKYLGIFPKPGVNEQDVLKAEVYGKTVKEALVHSDFTTLQEALIKMKAIEIKANLMFIESKGARLFKIWANLIIKKKNRKLWLRIYKYYLLIALFIVAPIVLMINIVIFRPFFLGKIARKKNFYLRLK